MTVNGAAIPSTNNIDTERYRGVVVDEQLAGTVSEEMAGMGSKSTGERVGEVVDDYNAQQGATTLTGKLAQNVDLVGAILTVVIAGAAAYAGLNVMSNISETMTLEQGDMFYNASQNLEDGISSFFSQMPTVFVVIALVLIISYLVILRR